jgi:TatD DNase family protein
MLIDAHCHLDQVTKPDAVVRAARAAGVERIVAVSQDLASMQAVLSLRDRHPDTVVTALGIHPQLIPSMEEGAVEEAFRFLEAHIGEADELGEVGLDYKHATTDDEKQRQRRWLDRQLGLAATHRKPANFHSRRAQRQVMEVAIGYQRQTGCPAQLHWFTQSKKLIRLTNEAGVMISAGPATLLGDDTLAVAATIDEDCLLLETDCPVPFGGDSARPEWIGRVLKRLAAARDTTPEALEARIEANFRRFLDGEVAPRGASV